VKILCVEDDEGLAHLLQQALAKQHYQVEIATDGQMGWNLIETSSYDLILLDWMLPKLTGIEFCQQLRAKNSSTSSPNRNAPILLMTALDAVTNKVLGLNAGADDYVVKPFELDELLARMRALLRRAQGIRSPLLQWGELYLNPNSCEVTYQQQPILLAAKEYELLELFLRHPDQIFSLGRLLMNLWSVEETPSEGAVRAHIKGLRQKLKQAGVNDPIETIYKLGYRLKQKQTGDQAERKDPVEPSHPSSPALSSAHPLSLVPPEFWDAWQECRQSYCDRLLVIEHALATLQEGILTVKQQRDAAQEAHTLIGSLGSFGLDKASQISRQIQKILKQQAPLGQAEAEQLNQLIATLRLYLENAGEEKAEKVERIEMSKEMSSLSPSLPVPCLLIVDDDLPLAQLLAKEALSWGIQAKMVMTLPDAQQFLQDHPVNAILLDSNCSASSENGLESLAALRCQYPDIPMVMLTAEEAFEKRVEAARLGIRCFLQKPIAPAQVLAAVTQVLQQTNRSAARILVVDDDPALLQLLSALLEHSGYQVTGLGDPLQFWQTLEQTAPDLLILDVELCGSSDARSKTQVTIPALSGIELCQVIRSDPRWNRLPVLFLSAHTDIETVQRSFAVGADDFLSKPVATQDLLTRVKTRLEQRTLWKTAELDELTGVSLRRKALLDLARLAQLAQRQQQPFSLAVLDLDHFKQINDHYGHAVGDRVLIYIGSLLRQSFRQEDIIGRWGGEEFIVGMYGITKQDGIKRLEDVLLRLNQHVFLAQSETPFQVTFSAGIAQLPDDDDELQTLYYYADQALYQAKSAGRNRIFAAESSHGSNVFPNVDRQLQEPL
jgi:diguanylate cyclase (GGDEF)-like protein